MPRIRLFGSHLKKRQQRVYLVVVAFYVVAALALTWPGYVPFSGIRPLVLGMPFSLFWVSCWVVASFLVLLALFRWEGQQAELSDEAERGPGAPEGPGERDGQGEGGGTGGGPTAPGEGREA